MLRGSWKLCKNWRKIEIPQRAPPLPRYVCLGIIGHFLMKEQVTMAFLIALGFHAYLRTGEILKLTRGYHHEFHQRSGSRPRQQIRSPVQHG